jgi:hypothetical protein
MDSASFVKDGGSSRLIALESAGRKAKQERDTRNSGQN